MSKPACVCTNLRRAARGVSRRYDEALEPVGVNVAQFALLRALERARGTLTLSELAAGMDLDASTLGRNVRVLERAGLVALGVGRDKRTREVGLTPKGEAALASGGLAWQRVQDEMDARLGAGGRRELFALLDRLDGAGERAGGTGGDGGAVEGAER